MAVLAGVGAAALVDLRTGRIPNALTVSMAASGVTLAAIGASGISIAASATGFVMGLLVMLPGHLLGATGAGDVKLVAAVGAVVGPANVLMAFLFTALAGGLIAVAVAMHRGRFGVTVAGAGRIVTSPGAVREHAAARDGGSRFAYGPAIAVGTLIATLT